MRNVKTSLAGGSVSECRPSFLSACHAGAGLTAAPAENVGYDRVMK